MTRPARDPVGSNSAASLPPPPDRARFLLLQMRNQQDPMRSHERMCFARSLGVPSHQIDVFDLLESSLSPGDLSRRDMVLLGGAGEYSAAGSDPGLERALDSLRTVYDAARPTFASCWGFQAFARALGGRVINDVSLAEVGTHPVSLTDDGRSDPLFSSLPEQFVAPMGHEDHVVELPPGAVHLARSADVEFQAFRFSDRPIYCTQFHPELQREDLILRVKAYPEYLERIAGMTLDEFQPRLCETPETGRLLQRFASLVFA